LTEFYGFSPDELGQLKSYEVSEYWQAIDVIEAQQTILQLKVISRKKFVKVEDFMKFAKARGLNGQ
jgi:hypothetical protein